MKEVNKGFLKCIHPLGIAIHARTQKTKKKVYCPEGGGTNPDPGEHI